MGAVMADFLRWNPFAWPLLIAALGALVAVAADRRRDRRAHLDRVGFMPWTLLSIFGVGATLMLAALAIRAGLSG